MRADINVHSKQSHMTGVQFPVTDEALAKLADLNEKKISLVQLVSETVVYTLLRVEKLAVIISWWGRSLVMKWCTR